MAIYDGHDRDPTEDHNHNRQLEQPGDARSEEHCTHLANDESLRVRQNQLESVMQTYGHP